MFSNYFKLAIKVLRRNKFFTFVSLFGISFTLMILMLITSFLDTELGNYPPLSEKEKMVFAPRISMKMVVPDTIMTIDSNLVNNQMEYDTAYDYQDNNRSTSTSSYGFPFLDKHYRDIPSAEKYTFYSPGHTFDVFKNSNKLTFNVVYTDATFWEVFDFKFLQGKPYVGSQVKNQAQIAIISEKAATDYFGTKEGVIGKEIILDKKHYEVVGIIQKTRSARRFLKAEAYIPYTNLSERTLMDFDDPFLGSFEAVFLAKNTANREQIQAEIKQKEELISMPNPEEYNKLELSSYTFLEQYAQDIYYKKDAKKSVKIVLTALIALLLLFILLPTLNLININVSRILERSSEIGVRKAFGAHSGNILLQFIFENVIITFIGGLIGCGLALILLNIINESQVLPNVQLAFNANVFLYSLLVCLFFGILSGILPAYRMSKLQIVKALKQHSA